MDSGSTAHIFSKREYFISWDDNFIPGSINVTVADGTVCENAIQGKGDVVFPVKDETNCELSISLKGVLFMPRCEYLGIYSVRRGVDSGDKIVFAKNESFLVTKNGTKIPLLKNENLLFLAATRVRKIPIAKRTDVVWHHILAHLSYDNIYKMASLVKGMEVLRTVRTACVPCIRGRAVQRYSKVPDPRAVAVFEFVHTDICGPFNVPDSIHDAKYIIVFVCDFSNFMTVYSLQKRSDAPDALRKYLASVRKYDVSNSKYGPVKRIRSDNAAEFTGNIWRDICIVNQIAMETSPSYCPWSNGTAERAFGTLLPKVRCMLQSTEAPLCFWPFAFKYSCYLYNRGPVKRISCTPLQMISGRMPDVARLQVWGSNVEVLDPHPDSKLSSRTYPAIFLGFDELSDSYLIYNKNTHRIQTSYRVFFVNDNDNVATTNNATKDLSFLDDIQNKYNTNDNNEQIQTNDDHDNNKSLYTDDLRPSNNTSLTGRKNKGGPYKNNKSCAHTSNMHDTTNNTNQTNNNNKIQSSDPKSKTIQSQNDENFSHDSCDAPTSRPKRKTSKPDRYGSPTSVDLCFNISCDNAEFQFLPKTFNEAITCKDNDKWWIAMTNEYNSLMQYHTFEYVLKPKDANVLPAMWIYNIKTEVDGSERFKARWVAKGYKQVFGKDYFETYAPMSRLTTIRLMCFLSVNLGFTAHQLDVSTAYLNSSLDQVLYMEPPTGFCGDKSLVCKLNK